MKRQLPVLVAMMLVFVATAPAAGAGERESYAYLRESSEFGWELIVTGSGGNQRVRVAADVIGRPAISPNGTKIAYAAPIGDGTLGRYAIFMSNVDGSGRTRITNPALGDRDPAWSPNGRQLAFSRNLTDDLNASVCCVIRVIGTDGTGITGVTGSLGGRNPAWSPDGTRIAYDTPAGVFVADVNGTNRIQLTGASGAEPAWSPDGSQIAYIRPLGNGTELAVRPSDGGNFTVRVSSTDFKIESPVWGRNGQTIYYVRHRGDGYLGRTAATVFSQTGTASPRLTFKPGADIAHLSRIQRASGGCDYDGDGYDDLALGVPGDNPGAGNAGSVNVLYGDQGGLTANGAQIWNRKNTQIVGIPRANAALGTAVACGDFNADGFTDLAAGAPGDESGRGSVMVLFGSASGLTATSDQRWEQDTVGVLSAGEPGDRFGTALTSGDFNGDGFADLAIGAPGEGSARGGVNVLFGGAGGLSAGGDAFLQQGGGGVDGIRRAGEEFGAALAAGDFDGDGIDDLAIGTPGEELSGKRDSGSVLVIEGSPAGLDTGADNIWHQDVSGVEGSAEAGDRFGESVAAGDFNSDGYDDLAIGAPDEDRSDITMAGSAQIIHGSNDGLTSSGDLRVFQGVGGVNGIAQEGDRFGASVAAGDFDGDGYDDLAIGSPGEDNEAGMASVLYGSTGSIDGSRDQHCRCPRQSEAR